MDRRRGLDALSGGIRAAAPTDLTAIEALLRASRLPVVGVADHLATFYVLESEAALVAVIGLEIHREAALVRSMAVSEAHRERGLASRLCEHAEAEAARRGVERLYLLTETARSFFERRGYGVGSRAEAPAAIASTPEFTQLCPQSAVFMHRAVGWGTR